jgi:DNA-binding NarL/FixJ family response regulator
MAAHLRLVPRPIEAASAREAARPIRVVLADDHALMRRGLWQLLEGEEDIEVIAEADDFLLAVGHVYRHRPHVLVLDLNMPNGSGLEVIGELCERVPGTRIVAITMNHSPMFAQRALAVGAVGFVLKDRADRELSEAVRAAARDEEYVSPRTADRLQAFRHQTR